MTWFNGWDITSQLKCDAASAASSIRSSPRSAKCPNVFAIAAIARFWPAFIEGLAQFREAARLADHHATKLHKPWGQDDAELPKGVVFKVGVQVAARRQFWDDAMHRVAARVGQTRHDLEKQRLLAGELLVDRLFRDVGQDCDLIHAAAEIAVLQEDGGRGFQDRPAFLRRASATLVGKLVVHGCVFCHQWQVLEQLRVLLTRQVDRSL
jgi:hypothetical protein